MEEKFFLHLLRIEPGVKELTKEEYERSMGIGQPGPKGEAVKDVGESMEADPGSEDVAPLYAGTKKDLIETLKERGFKAGELNRKTKKQLIEML